MMVLKSLNMSRNVLLMICVCLMLGAGLCCKGSARADRAPAAQAHSAAADKDVFTLTSPGRWFTDAPSALRKQVDGFIDKAEAQELPGRVVALISPHAGYQYSGPVAGYAYRQVQGRKYDTVVVVGFRHGALPYDIATYDRGAFRTPLGDIPIDMETTAALVAGSELIKHNPEAFKGEHSLDTQLPFLQRALGEFKLVPILLCEQTAKNVDELSRVLPEVLKDKNVLLVASTDMSHFWPHEEAANLDAEVIDRVVGMDPDGLGELLKADPTGRRLCGRGAVRAVMHTAKALGADGAQLLKYADSQDTTGVSDPEHGVVGYMAVAFTDSSKSPLDDPGYSSKSGEKHDYPGELDQDDQAELLEIARQSLEEGVRNGQLKTFETDRPRLKEKRGVFVTLNKNGELRGCMGHFDADTPLYEIVAHQVLVSAFQDPRFPQVQAQELDHITIEISVLSIPEPVDSYEDIEVGLHGVILQKDGRGATFLPQVAPDQGWDRDEMLNHLSRKAGLSTDAWKQGATFLTYTAQVFSEDE